MNPNTAYDAERKISPLEDANASLKESADGLHKTISALESRLYKITRDVETAAATLQTNPEPLKSPDKLSSSLRETTQSITNASIRINDLMDRLEV